MTWLLGGRIIKANRGLIEPALALGQGQIVRVPSFGLKESDEVARAIEKAADNLASAQHKANHDDLTGLPNRSLFYEIVASQAQLAVRNESTFSLLFIDLDGFKKVNDKLGHAAGDEVLRLVAVRIKSLLRLSDTASRLGGDEFAVALPDTTGHDAEIVAAKIVHALSVPYVFDSQVMNINGLFRQYIPKQSLLYVLQEMPGIMRL